MKEISFNWTVTAFLAGAKTVTRRAWKDVYAATFKKGDLVAAYDKQRRFGGRQIGIIELTCDPYKENTADMPADDWYAEGLPVLEGEGKLLDGVTPGQYWRRLKSEEPVDLWVIRFDVLEIC